MPQPKVLFIEDTPSDVALIGAHLRSDGRFSLTHVETLAAACDLLGDGAQIDVVILDLNLPDSMGMETFTSLQRRFPDTPVVVLSGQDDLQFAMAAVNQGAQDYVPKTDVQADGRLLVRSLLYAIERNGRQLAERRNLLIERELSAARRIQRHLLPEEPPKIEGFDIAAVCRPAEACGGDFYDFITLPDGRWDWLVGDASGHGLGPALIMVGARRILRTCALMCDDIGDALTIADRAVAEDTLCGLFVSLFYARLDPADRTFTYCAAGHPAWVINAGAVAKPLSYVAPPLGLIPDITYATDGSVALQSGDMVLVMTDGAWGAASPDGPEFGQHRIFEFLHQHRRHTAAEILQMLLQAIGRFCHPCSPHDDLTLVLLKAA